MTIEDRDPSSRGEKTQSGVAEADRILTDSEAPSEPVVKSGLDAHQEANLTPEEIKAEKKLRLKIDFIILPLVATVYFLAALVSPWVLLRTGGSHRCRVANMGVNTGPKRCWERRRCRNGQGSQHDIERTELLRGLFLHRLHALPTAWRHPRSRLDTAGATWMRRCAVGCCDHSVGVPPL